MKRLINKRLAGLLVCVILILCATVGGTLAYVFIKPPAVGSTFAPARVSCAVVENFTNNVKTDVRVKNTGDATAYIRVAVLTTWKYQDRNGVDHNHAQSPIPNVDYTIIYAENTNWLLGVDGYWYYAYPVPCAKNAQAEDVLTEILISQVKLLENAMAPDGYTLSVEIVASAIQAEPITAAAENWGLTVDQDGVIASVRAGGEATCNNASWD